VSVELEALRTSVVLVWDLVLGEVNVPSSLAVSLSMVESLKDRIDIATTNGVHWRTHSTLVAALSHFLELKSELELFGSGWNADQADNQADALWPSCERDLRLTSIACSFLGCP
jgi:hypothetical protein